MLIETQKTLKRSKASMDVQRLSEFKLRSIFVRLNRKIINIVEKLRNTICENLFTPSLAVIRLVIMSRRVFN